MAERPDPPDKAPDGYHWEAPAEDPLIWRLLLAGTAKRCRMQKGRHEHCGKPAVAEMNRKRHAPLAWDRYRLVDRWWAYCGEHLYGRWIEDGQILYWRLVPDKEKADG